MLNVGWLNKNYISNYTGLQNNISKDAWAKIWFFETIFFKDDASLKYWYAHIFPWLSSLSSFAWIPRNCWTNSLLSWRVYRYPRQFPTTSRQWTLNCRLQKNNYMSCSKQLVIINVQLSSIVLRNFCLSYLSLIGTIFGVSANVSTIWAITLSRWFGHPWVNQIGSFDEYNLRKKYLIENYRYLNIHQVVSAYIV